MQSTDVYLFNSHKDFYILAQVEIVREYYGLTKEIKILNIIVDSDPNTDYSLVAKHISEEFLYTDKHRLVDHLFLFGLG